MLPVEIESISHHRGWIIEIGVELNVEGWPRVADKGLAEVGAVVVNAIQGSSAETVHEIGRRRKSRTLSETS